METETSTTLTALLMRRARFLALAACTLAAIGTGAHLLGVDQPYPEHAFTTDGTYSQVVAR